MINLVRNLSKFVIGLLSQKQVFGGDIEFLYYNQVIIINSDKRGASHSLLWAHVPRFFFPRPSVWANLGYVVTLHFCCVVVVPGSLVFRLPASIRLRCL